MDFPAMLDHQKVMYFFCDWGLLCWGWWNFGVVSFVCNETIPDRGCSLKRASMWHSLVTHPPTSGIFPSIYVLRRKNNWTLLTCCQVEWSFTSLWPTVPVIHSRRKIVLIFNHLFKHIWHDRGQSQWQCHIFNTEICWNHQSALQKIHSMLAVSRPR